MHLMKALGVIAVLGSNACQEVSWGPGTSQQEKDEFVAARSSWQAAGIDSYDFIYTGGCGECDVSMFPARINVRGGMIAGAISLASGEALEVDRTDLELETVSELFDRIALTIRENDLKVEADYDANLGYPVRYEMSCRDRNIMDCFYTFQVSEFLAVDP